MLIQKDVLKLLEVSRDRRQSFIRNESTRRLHEITVSAKSPNILAPVQSFLLRHFRAEGGASWNDE